MAKIEELLSLARKAGYVIVGKDNLCGYSKKLFLLIMDKSAGNSLTREMNFISAQKNIPILIVDELAQKLKIQNCKAIGLKNKAMAENIEKCLKGE